MMLRAPVFAALMLWKSNLPVVKFRSRGLGARKRSSSQKAPTAMAESKKDKLEIVLLRSTRFVHTAHHT